MEEAGNREIARYERPESRDGAKMGRSGGASRRERATVWPAEISNARGVFTSHRTLTGLGAFGRSANQVRIEVRSCKGAGVWVMALGLGNPVGHGRTLSEATAALIKLIDPEIEVVTSRTPRC